MKSINTNQSSQGFGYLNSEYCSPIGEEKDNALSGLSKLKIEVESYIETKLPTTKESQSESTVNHKQNESLSEFGITDLPYYENIKSGIKLLKKHPCLGSLKEDKRKIPLSRSGHIYKAIEFTHSLKIAFLSDLTMASAAYYYNRKYGVDIKVLVASEYKRFIEFVNCLINKLDNGYQCGLVARIGLNTAHMTPILFSKKNDLINIVVLDSAGRTDSNSIHHVIKSLNTDENYRVIFINPERNRQCDLYSCRSDSILVLKNALKHSDFMSLLKSDVDELENSKKRRYPSLYIYLTVNKPNILSKTIQNKAMIDELKLSANNQVSIRCEGSLASAEHNIKSHLEKYTRSVSANIKHTNPDAANNTERYKSLNAQDSSCKESENKQIWEVNMYLQVKGYSLVCKAFSKLNDGNGEIDQKSKDEVITNYIVG